MKGLHFVSVDPHIADDPKIAALAARLRRDRYWIVGHFPRFLGAVATHCPDGNIGAIGDALLDEWAGGVKGWGEAVRDLLTEDGGQLTAWWKYNGRKLERLRKDRARKAAQWEDE